MLDELSLELLNAEIDGTLSPADRAELSRRLLESPELRTFREELQRACSGLESLPLAEPPPGLRDRILAALPVPPTGRVGEHPPRRARWLGAGTARFAAAVIAGSVVAAIAFHSSRESMQGSVEQASGTMARAPDDVPAGAGVLRVDATQVRGTLRMTPTVGGLAVRFVLDPAQPPSAVRPGQLEVIVTRGTVATRLRETTAAQQSAPATLGADLPGALAPGEVVDVRVQAAGIPIFAGRWQAPAPL